MSAVLLMQISCPNCQTMNERREALAAVSSHTVVSAREIVACTNCGKEIPLDVHATVMIEREPIYRTKTGRVLSEVDIQALADEAERGYPVEQLRERDSRRALAGLTGVRAACGAPRVTAGSIDGDDGCGWGDYCPNSPTAIPNGEPSQPQWAPLPGQCDPCFMFEHARCEHPHDCRCSCRGNQQRRAQS